MKNNMSLVTAIGALVLAAYIIIDKFIVQLPDWVAIPVLVIAATLLVFGLIKRKTDK
jgi:uncharacterized protein (DUF983 family)